MIVVVEGIDRVGKTTLVNKLVDVGFVNLKDEFVMNNLFLNNFSDYSIGKCDSLVALASKLEQEGKNVVIDRLHLTELVYGKVIRKESNISACWEIDNVLANMNAKLVYVKPTDIEWSSEKAGMNLEKLNDMFEKVTKISLLDTIVTDFDNLNDAFGRIIFNAFQYDFYFASPFFNDEQIEREERMIAHLRNQGLRVFSPKENCLLDSKASFSSREAVFKSNCDAINNSVGVFAVTDGKDMGTIWEAGYAYGIGKPVIYYAETLGNNKFNLMLSQSGRDVYTSQQEVTFGSLIDSLHGVRRKFRGDIE